MFPGNGAHFILALVYTGMSFIKMFCGWISGLVLLGMQGYSMPFKQSYDAEDTMFSDSCYWRLHCTHSPAAVSWDVIHRHIQNSSASHHETKQSGDEWTAARAGDLLLSNDLVCQNTADPVGNCYLLASICSIPHMELFDQSYCNLQQTSVETGKQVQK